MANYLPGTNHGARLTTALEQFEEALTRRWREVVCEAVFKDSWDFPRVIRREVTPHHHEPLWNFSSLPARYHLTTAGYCDYLMWVWAGQPELIPTSCSGYTGMHHEPVKRDHHSGSEMTIPEYIECGMGSILARVADWAGGERWHVANQLPWFDGHDVAALEGAYHEFIRLGGRLGLEAGAGSSADVSFTSMHERAIPGVVSNISSRNADGQDWWAGWTGLAASRARSGFFASVTPTVNNQSGILGSLANLYSDRATIIEKGRNDGLYWLQWATRSLGETELITTDRTNGWKVVQGIGMGITLTSGWSGVGAAVGTAVTLVGFLGENLGWGTAQTEVGSGLVDVVEHLNDQVRELNFAVAGYETDYFQATNRLRHVIQHIHSYNLELYDFTANDPEGDRGDDRSEESFEVDLDSVLRLAEHCYKLGERYEELLPILSATTAADQHLADKDGIPTMADQAVLGIRDQLYEFLKTTCGRYLVAGDQVKTAADLFSQTENGNREQFEDIMAGWKDEDVGEYDVPFDPEEHAEETFRLGRTPPEDATDYVTEAEK